jgi:hypothetical protein
MSLSRVLQQLKMIHVEKLMGSSLKDIRIQLFGDAFLTVLLAFGLSLLIINDCLSFFQWIICIPFKRTFPFQPTDATLVSALCTSYVHCPCLVSANTLTFLTSVLEQVIVALLLTE